MKRLQFLLAQQVAKKEAEFSSVNKFAANLPKKHFNFDLSTKKALKTLLKKRKVGAADVGHLGFYLSKGGSWESKVFVGPKFVIKSANIVGPKPKLAIPTAKVVGDWIVQPVCQVFKTLPEKKKTELIRSGVCDYHGRLILEGSGRDPHDGNWGLLNGKVVQHDW